MKRIKQSIWILSIILLVSSCSAIMGEEIGRLAINEVSQNDSNLIEKEVTLELHKGDQVSLWSDMDFSHKGAVNMAFKLLVLEGEEVIHSLEIDPREKNITVGEVKTEIMGKTSWSFTGKNGEVDFGKDGTYTFRGIFVASDNPSLKVEKAELVLKK